MVLATRKVLSRSSIRWREALQCLVVILLCAILMRERSDANINFMESLGQTKQTHNLPRVLSSVLGQDTSLPFLESLDKLKRARPQLATEIQHLEHALYNFSVSALSAVESDIDVDFTLELLKPKLPSVVVHKAVYGPQNDKLDVTWILRKLVVNSVLRIPAEFPLDSIFGTHPKNSTPGENWMLDVEATRSGKGLEKISIPVTGYRLKRDLLISTAANSVVVTDHAIDETIQRVVKDKVGVEIGGPTGAFERKGVYSLASRTDMVNFSEDTLWGTFKDGSTFDYKKGGSGTVHITDGSTLVGIQDEIYDFVLGSHYLEHLINPFKALLTMRRVLKPGGYVVLILPFKDACFDHYRGVSRIEEFTSRHLLQVTEEELDYSNLPNWVFGNDLSKDPKAGDFQQLLARSLRFQSNKAIHTMVYDLDLLRDIAQTLRFEVTMRHLEPPLNQYIVLRKR